MSKDKPKHGPKSSSPRELATTKKKGSVELNEEELKRASGGGVPAVQKVRD